MLNCPFCGILPIGPKDFKKTDGEVFFSVVCLECEYHGPPANTPLKSIEFWNTRK